MKKTIYLLPVILVLLLSNCNEKKAKPKDPPIAAFSADKTTIDEGQTINFLDESENDPSGWAWNFGDDEDNDVHSTSQDPSHTYTKAGTYTVILAVANNAGEDAMVKTNYITVNSLGYPPNAAFTVNETSIDKGESVQFTDQSTNDPTNWSWSFGDGTTSTQQNPVHTYSTSGTYSVSLIASNSFGQDTETKSSYITVNEKPSTTDVTFNNKTFTDIYATFKGVSKTIPPGESVTYNNLTGTSATLDAYTSGKTSGGSQVGLKLTWDNTIDLTGGNVSHNLIVGSDYFFIYVRNNGTHVLTPLYVNYGLSSQTYDNIMIPADNVKYRIGYYNAYSNSNVRMYYQDNTSAYTYWNQGTHFTLPWTDNQSVELYNNLRKSTMKGSPVYISADMATLIPESIPKNKSNFDNKAIKLYCK